MKWMNRRGSDNVEDQRGAGAKLSAGGGIGFLIVGAIVYFLGGDPSFFLQQGISRTVGSISTEAQAPPRDQDQAVKFVSVVLAETEDVWKAQFADQKLRYKEPKLVFFSNSVSSACGNAQSSMGPFYCPMDEKIYIDLTFFNELEHNLQVSGDFAQAYVVAHEVGHHVQNSLGILEKTNALKANRSEKAANQISVKTELMADCLAGVWASSIQSKGLLEEGDVKEALNAATQIGDDRLQEQARGYAVPDSFTHGTSLQRYEAFHFGITQGSFKPCLAQYTFTTL